MPKRPVRNSTTTKPITLAQHAELLQREETMRRTIDSLQRANAKERDRTQALTNAIVRGVREASSGLVIPPVPPPPRRASKRSQVAEKALVVVSDLQLAKVTPTYNTDVAERRMMDYADKVIRLAEIQRADHPVDEARVYFLGDIVEGELIFPHQPYQIDSSLYRQTVVDGPRILINFIRKLLTAFQKVHCVGVIGNHGAIGGTSRRLHNPETNADRMLYTIVKDRLDAEPRLTWDIPYMRNERSWYAVDYPFDLLAAECPGFFLFHGDQIQNGASVSTGTIARRVWGWASGAVPEPFKYAIWGHWHSPKRIDLNSIVTWCNGSLESTNTYAQEWLSAMGQPQQLLLFCHPEHGVTAEYWVHL